MSQTPRISILGDSISTFEGYMPTPGVFYTASYVSYSGFSTVDETWWMQTIRQLGGELITNNSFQGSFLGYGGLYPAILPGRIRSLATDEAKPDLILIYTGLNDVATHIPLDTFRSSCLELLDKVKRTHPQAQVWMGTLCRGQDPAPGRPFFIEPEELADLDAYNQIIRECVAESGCHLADFAGQGVTYATMDGMHPNKEGMVTFANAWVKNLTAAQ